MNIGRSDFFVLFFPSLSVCRRETCKRGKRRNVPGLLDFLHPSAPEPCLAQSRHSVNICWVNWFVVVILPLLDISGKLFCLFCAHGTYHGCDTGRWPLGQTSWPPPAHMPCAPTVTVQRPQLWWTNPLSQGLPRGKNTFNLSVLVS